MMKLFLLVIAALFAVAMAVPTPVAGPNPEPNPQWVYGGYPAVASYPYVYYG
ncbi:PREDICTED: neuropeptide-like 4 [Rhagoletis zephyria]|uniref:neuropeptide-like 4 n=1 Tax=Rhagoletis zephyria TaxID=28612 RepID=UPI00081143D2|nr:PREDICTED: neuropeptide-like 4 [Rhagoletis zephyria]